jgi:hypothetical protein
LKLDYVQLGATPFTDANVPPSIVGVAITPVALADNLASCITPTLWEAEGLPAGLEIDASTGVISGTPTTASAEPATATITVSYGTDKILKGYVYFGTVSLPSPTPFVIEANETKTKADYEAGNYNDLIIKSDNTGTGQLDLQGGTLTVNGQVKLRKSIAPGAYPLGFPYAVETVWSYYFESQGSGYEPFDLSFGTDYSAKEFQAATSLFEELNANPFTAGNAGKGYAVSFVPDFDNTDIGFFSGANPSLSAGSLAVSSDGTYQLAANTAYLTLNLTQGDGDKYYYQFDGTNIFVQPVVGQPVSIAPFEAVITVGGITDPNALHGNFYLSPITGINQAIDAANDPVVSVSYYNLQGVSIDRPQKGCVYIVKETLSSGKVNVEKKQLAINN